MDRHTSMPPSASGAEQDAPDFDYPEWFADAPPPPSGDSPASALRSGTAGPVTGEIDLSSGVSAEAEPEESLGGLQPEEPQLSFDDPDLPSPPGDSGIEDIPEETVTLPESRPALLASVELHLDVTEEAETEAPARAPTVTPPGIVIKARVTESGTAEIPVAEPAPVQPLPAAAKPARIELPDPEALTGKPSGKSPVLAIAIAAGVLLMAALGAAIMLKIRAAPVAAPAPAAIQPPAQAPAVSLSETAEPEEPLPVRKKQDPFAAGNPDADHKPDKPRKNPAAAKPAKRTEEPPKAVVPESVATAVHLDPEPPPKAPEPEEPEEADDGGNPFGWMKKNISGTLGKVNDAIEGRRKAGEKK